MKKGQHQVRPFQTPQKMGSLDVAALLLHSACHCGYLKQILGKPHFPYLCNGANNASSRLFSLRSNQSKVASLAHSRCSKSCNAALDGGLPARSWPDLVPGS